MFDCKLLCPRDLLDFEAAFKKYIGIENEKIKKRIRNAVNGKWLRQRKWVNNGKLHSDATTFRSRFRWKIKKNLSLRLCYSYLLLTFIHNLRHRKQNFHKQILTRSAPSTSVFLIFSFSRLNSSRQFQMKFHYRRFTPS